MKTLGLRIRKRENQSYKILVKSGLFREIAGDLAKESYGQKYCIVTDSNVRKLYGDKLLRQLRKEKIPASMVVFRAGERSKAMKMVEKITQEMARLGITRDDCVIALGGGVVGDTAAFAASIYMRGISLVQVPSTLVSMVDSSIGGKTGVNLTTGKNLVGTFHQPKKVYIDPELLKTLSEKQFKSGLAEVIKCGIIAKRRIFRILFKKPEEILNLSQKLLNKLIVQCLRIKRRIVQKDEKEKGIRTILNYGHTFGHAIEKLSKYRISHGFAIAIGMNLINEIAVNKGLLKNKFGEKIRLLLKKYDLPVNLPKKMKPEIIWEMTKGDKKVKNGKISFVVPTKIGKVQVVQGITKADLKKVCG